MRKIAYIPVILLLVSCGSLSKSVKGGSDKALNEDRKILTQLVEPQQPDELTASLSMNISGVKVSGQLRMRRDHSIQISASMLGLMEVARVEFLPDKVVVMDRIHNRYSVCHYAFLPERNELGLDFKEIQAIFWNRAFSPENNSSDKYGCFVIQDRNPESFTFKETNFGYVFVSNESGKLVRTIKPGVAVIDYSNFTGLSKEFNFPLDMTVDINAGDLSLKIPVRLSSVNITKQKWPDQTQVSRRMTQVELEDILDDLTL